MKVYLTSCLEKIKAKYAEIRYEERRITRVHYVGKELEFIGESETRGGGIRVQGKNGWSFISFNKLEKLKDYLNEAARQACIARGREVRLAPAHPRVEVIRAKVKKDPRQISLEEKYHLCTRYNQILLSPKKVQSSSLRYFDVHTVKYFANTEGTYIEQERVDTVIGMTAIARDGTNIQFAHEGIGGTGGYELVEGLEDKAEEVSRRAVELLEAEPASAGKYTVVVDPKLSGVFAHEAFGHLSEADFLYENDRLREIMQLGRRFGPPELNIVDEAPIEGQSGYYLYDDEGVPAQKTYLIKEGKLVGYLHSRETAAKMGAQPTGNARAISYRYPPIVRMSNTYIEPQDKSKEEIISEVEEGIYARGFRGGQTNLEMFTFCPEEGYLIKKGKLVKKIRDFNLTGNIFTTLFNIEAIGDDLVLFGGPGGCGKAGQSPLPVSTGGPHLRIREVIVGGV
ncbi:MAG TPA: TldD/PmbA family protein [Candidatus Aerophobetes bacterium]|nr:TldD/PmbA family protein [Candidatus Aerophobetes bacterium]